jgi:arylsulfatase A-like enzyme
LPELAEREAMLGKSLLPLLHAPQSKTAQTYPFIHITENTWMKKRGLRTSEWKYIRALEPDIHGFPEEELYRLSDDPGEKRNLAQTLPLKAAEFRTQLDQYVASRLNATGLSPDPLLDQPLPRNMLGPEHAGPDPKVPGNTVEQSRPVKSMADHADLL